MPSDNDQNLAKVLNINIHKDWDLSVRTSNCLKTFNIIYVGELIQYQEKDLFSFINFGQKSLDEINKKLSEYSLKLGTQNVKWEIDHNKIENKNINQKKIEEMIKKRDKARKERDFVKSDKIRNELALQNIILEDTPKGTFWRIRN